MGFFSSIGNAFKSVGRSIGGAATKVFGGISHGVTKVFGGISSGVTKVFNKTVEIGTKAVNWTAHAVEDTARTAYSVGKGIVDRGTRLADAGVNSIEGISKFLTSSWMPFILGGAGLLLIVNKK